MDVLNVHQHPWPCTDGQILETMHLRGLGLGASAPMMLGAVV